MTLGLRSSAGYADSLSPGMLAALGPLAGVDGLTWEEYEQNVAPAPLPTARRDDGRPGVRADVVEF
jgi:hypothetical protein